MANKLTKEELKKAKKLLESTDLNKNIQQTQDMHNDYFSSQKRDDVWVISDSSSNFSSLNLKNG